MDSEFILWSYGQGKKEKLQEIKFREQQNKMHKSITGLYKNYNIMSALVLREFLYQL